MPKAAAISVSGRPLEGWRVASKGLGPLHRTRGSALALGCGRSGRVALPLPQPARAYTPVALSMSSSSIFSPHMCSGKSALSSDASSSLSNSPFPSSSNSSHQRSSFAWGIRTGASPQP